jgi:hypothetical protein
MKPIQNQESNSQKMEILNGKEITTPEPVKEAPSSNIIRNSVFILLGCLGMLGVSSVIVIFELTIPFSVVVILWYLSAAIGLLLVLILFLKGMYQVFINKSFRLVGVSLLFLVILVLVGVGTCLKNMSSMSF